MCDLVLVILQQELITMIIIIYNYSKKKFDMYTIVVNNQFTMACNFPSKTTLYLKIMINTADVANILLWCCNFRNIVHANTTFLFPVHQVQHQKTTVCRQLYNNIEDEHFILQLNYTFFLQVFSFSLLFLTSMPNKDYCRY